MPLSELEVVWPLHRSHYLSQALADAGIDMDIAPESANVPPTPVVRPVATSRELATRALQAGAHCSQQRVSELLGVSRRTLSRNGEPDFVSALHDADVVEQARTCLADSVSRGSTSDEREAAAAWLVQAMRDEHQIEQFHQRTSVRRPAAKGRVTIRAGTRNGGGPAKRPGATPAIRVRPVAATVDIDKSTVVMAEPDPPQTVFARDQLDALTRQQQRIVHRSALLAYVIAAENRSGHALTLGDALAELLSDITDAAHTIGTILRGVRPQ